METGITKNYLDLSLRTTHFNRYLDRLVKLFEIRDCELEVLQILSKDFKGCESEDNSRAIEDELNELTIETQSALDEVNTSIMTNAKELVGLYRAAFGL